ncbi:MAG: hypothetical protein AMJ81_02775 [Phycisphaerae bacterium SM23_33]|nr:MAG: hypothetical protein AMJ81_02775 [Phycisphaerae bacterium SM23_33]
MPDLLGIVGQDEALAQLQRVFAAERRPHAYIFAGPEGVGRRTTAVEFGRLLLCDKPVSRANRGRLTELPASFPLQQGCGRCPSCRTVTAGTSPDLHVIYRQLARHHDDPQTRERVMQDLSIDVIRQFLIAPAYRAAAGGRGKVFVVREAELMSREAQNALLKTLEEPPAGVTLILIATSPADLLPTTRSRCQTIRFAPLPLRFVAETLTAHGVDEREAEFWAAMTGGSVGQAQRLAAQGLYEFKKELVERVANLSAANTGALAELLTKAMAKQAKRLTGTDEGLAATLANRQAGQVILGLLSSAFRDALTLASQADRPLVNAEQAGAIQALAGRLPTAQLAEILSQLARYEQLLWSNVNAKLLWANLAITCASAAPLGV